MKYILLMLGLVIFSCKENGYEMGVLYEGQCIAIPDYYRRLFGYDSVQFIDFMGKREANFCYPNKFRDYQRDTLYFDLEKMPYLRDSSGYLVPNNSYDSAILKMQDGVSFDTLYVQNALYIDTIVPPDKTKLYYHKFLYFNKKLNDPRISRKKFDMYEDSCKKYLDLWLKFKK